MEDYMAGHDIDYEVIGEGVQFVEITLDPGETVIAEAGAMVYMEEGNFLGSENGGRFESRSRDYGQTVLGRESACWRVKVFFLTHFTNNASSRKAVGFAGNIPGSVVGVDLSKIGGAITCQRDAFLCAAKGTKITGYLHEKIGSGFLRR